MGFGGDSAAIGLSIRHLYSSEPGLNNPTTVSLGISSRSTPYIGFSAVAHDINAQSSSTTDGVVIDRSYTIGAVLRPTGTRFFDIGIEGRYYEGFDTSKSASWSATGIPFNQGWVPRATLGIDIPYFGRLNGDIAVPSFSDKQYVATATLDLAMPHATITGGAIFGSAIGGKDGTGAVIGASITEWIEPNSPEFEYALRIRIEQTPSIRRHTALLRKLWRASKDPAVRAVVFVIKDEPASSLSNAYEIDDAVRVLRFRGKKVVCHLEDAGRRSLLACANADRIVINPAGGLGVLGLRNERLYYAGLLKKLGVRTQFVRIGEHKSAPEQLTNTGPSPTAKSDNLEHINQLTSELVDLIARGRKSDNATIKASIDASPLTAAQAIERNLVDGFAFDDELDAVVGDVAGRRFELRDELTARAPRKFGRQPSVAIVYVDGNIVSGRSSQIPLLGIDMVGSYTIADSLEKVRKDPNVDAVVLRIDSPGGSAMASDVMWRAVALTARVKPVVVSMAGVAASGGYYLAAAGTKIFATPFTVTGSIGVFYGKVDVSELLGRIGVNVDTVKTSPSADAESIFRPFTPEEVEELGLKIKHYYDIFVDRVSKGRDLSPEQVDSIGQGRVWLGRKGVEHKLVDELGGLRQALNTALVLTGLSDDVNIIELPPPQFSLLGLAASMLTTEDSDAMKQLSRKPVPHEIGLVLRSVAPFIIYDPFQPLSISDITIAP